MEPTFQLCSAITRRLTSLAYNTTGWKSQEYANYCHGLANMKVGGQSELSWLNNNFVRLQVLKGKEGREGGEEGKSQEFANVMWGNAVLGGGDGFWDVVKTCEGSIEGWVNRRVEGEGGRGSRGRLQCQEISIMSYSVAVLWKEDSSRWSEAVTFLDSLVSSTIAIGKWDDFKPQEISNYLWSASTLSYKDWNPALNALLFKNLQKLSVEKIKQFGNLELQNLVWAVSREGDSEGEVEEGFLGSRHSVLKVSIRKGQRASAAKRVKQRILNKRASERSE